MSLRQLIKMDRSPRVLVATDLGSRSDAAISRAHAIAQGLGAQLLLAHVVDLAKSARAVGRRRTRARLALDVQSSELARLGSEVQTSVRTGRPHEVIADLAIEWDADLVVLGPYRRSFGDSFRGTTAERVIRRARHSQSGAAGTRGQSRVGRSV